MQSTASSFTLVQTTMPLSSLPPTDASPDADKDAIHLLIHATNSFGTWSAGFALALRKLFPAADLVYKSYCNDVRPSPDEWPTRDLMGRCLFVAPQKTDVERRGSLWIGCVFTSYGYGKRAVRGPEGHAAKDSAAKVVAYTKTALEDLRAWVEKVEKNGFPEEEHSTANTTSTHDKNEVLSSKSSEEQPHERKEKKTKVVIYSPKFNSGNFGVEWEITAAMIRETFDGWDGEWRILADR